MKKLCNSDDGIPLVQLGLYSTALGEKKLISQFANRDNDHNVKIEQKK